MSVESNPSADRGVNSNQEGEMLPDGEYLWITLSVDGQVQIQGTRAAIEAFLRDCARAGLAIEGTELQWCG